MVEKSQNKKEAKNESDESQREVYHTESVVKFSTVHTTLTVYEGIQVFDSVRLSDGKRVATPETHRKKLLKMVVK